jgi:hypothetical protein|nr:MAG TPA: hypothetical protein [Bacteriophage sp.]
MGVIYVNGGFKKAKLPVDLKDSSVNIGGNQGLDISVEDDGILVITSQNIELDKVVENEILNII